MSERELDARFESLLRAALAAEVEDLPLTVGPERILGRGRAHHRSSIGSRLRLPRFSTMVEAGAVVALVAVAAVLLTNLPRPLDPPVASLPTSPADWSRVEIDTPPDAGAIRHIAAGAGGLVAVAGPDTAGRSRVFFSTDGRDWSEAGVSPRGEYVSVVATNRGFLMIDDEGARTSEDGIDWQRVADNWSGDPDAGGAIVVGAVAGGPGFVAFGNHNSIWSSTDGSDWAPADVPPPPAEFIRPEYPVLTVDFTKVAAVGEHLVAVGYVYMENQDTSITRDIVLTSTDGKTWSSVLGNLGDRKGPLQLAAGPNGFLVIGGPLDGGAASIIWHSADGVAWQNVGTHDFGAGLPADVELFDAAANSSGYVVVGRASDCFGCPAEAHLWTSADGRSWSKLVGREPFDLGRSSLESVVATGSGFVVGGEHLGRPAIWISGSERPDVTSTPNLTPTPEAMASSAPATPRIRATASTANGRPVAAGYAFLNGLVTMSAADPWGKAFERDALELVDGSGGEIVLVLDPHASGNGCGYVPAHANAAALAGSLRFDPDLEVTVPVAATLGGSDALQMDLALAAGATVCDGSSPVLRLPGSTDWSSDRRSANLAPGTRMRLYLIDRTEGTSSRIMAIAIVAPEARFEAVMDASTPVIASVAFPS